MSSSESEEVSYNSASDSESEGSSAPEETNSDSEGSSSGHTSSRSSASSSGSQSESETPQGSIEKSEDSSQISAALHSKVQIDPNSKEYSAFPASDFLKSMNNLDKTGERSLESPTGSGEEKLNAIATRAAEDKIASAMKENASDTSKSLVTPQAHRVSLPLPSSKENQMNETYVDLPQEDHVEYEDPALIASARQPNDDGGKGEKEWPSVSEEELQITQLLLAKFTNGNVSHV